MTIQETAQIMEILQIAYPRFYKDVTEEEKLDALELWSSMFVEEDYRLVAEAVKAHIATDEKGYPPVIGVIKKQIRNILQPKEMTELEAWNLVLKACSNALYNAHQEFEKLPDNIKSLVGNPGTLKEWALMNTDQLNTVVQSNFMRSYKVRTEKEKEYQALPPSVREITKELAAGMNANTLLLE